MFNLYNDTNHEAGIIVYEDNAVGVFNWAECGDNCIPMLSPFGTPINWPVDVDDAAEIVHAGFVDDVREYLPGTVFLKDGELTTDMDIGGLFPLATSDESIALRNVMADPAEFEKAKSKLKKDARTQLSSMKTPAEIVVSLERSRASPDHYRFRNSFFAV